MDQVTPFWALSSKGAKKEPIGSKGAIGGPLGDKLNLTLGISELHLKSKKILICVK